MPWSRFERRIIRMRDGRIREDETRPVAAPAREVVLDEGVLQPVG